MTDDAKALVLQLSASTELFRANLSQAERALAEFERKTKADAAKVNKNFTLMGSGLDKVSAGFNKAKVAAAGFLAGVSLSALVAVSKRSLDFASSLGEVAQQLGVTTRDLQAYRYAASQVGISQEAMDKGLARLTRTMGDARNGAEKPMKAFKALSDILGRDILASSRTAGDAIPLIADALAKIEDPARRASYEVALFGKTGQQLDTLLAGGSKGVNELTSAAERLGIVLSDDLIQRADEAADKLSAMKQVLEAQIAATVAENADAIVGLAGGIMKLVSALVQFQNTNPRETLGILGALGGALVGGRFGPYGAAAGAAIGGLGGYINAPVTDQQKLNEEISGQEARLLQLQANPVYSKAVIEKEKAKLQALKNRKLGAYGLTVGSGSLLGPNAPPMSRTPGYGEGLDLPEFLGRGRSGSKTAGDSFDYNDPSEMFGIIAKSQFGGKDVLADLLGVDPGKALDDYMEKLYTAQDALYEQRQYLAEEAHRREMAQVDTLAQLFEDGFRGGTKAIWQDFKDIGLAVIAQLLAKFAMAQVSGGGFDLGSAFSAALGSVLGFADGGNPPVGKVSVVGERGPELFVPKVAGTIIPNHALGGGNPINISINAPGATAETVVMIRREIMNATPLIVQAANQSSARTMSRRRLG